MPCAFAILGAYTFLPPLIDGLVARSLQDGLGLVDAPRVDLESDPASGVLLGEFQGGEVTLADPDLGGVRPDEVSVNLDPFDLEVPGSVANGRIESKEPLSGTFRAELSEEEVARITASSDTAVTPVRSVRLGEGYAVLGSEAEVLGTRVPIDVEGERADIEWGSQIRSYVLHPYKMVKDHRTGEQTADVDRVLDGDLDTFIYAYLKSRAAV